MSTIWERLATSTPINRMAVRGISADVYGVSDQGRKLPYDFVRSHEPLPVRPYPDSALKSDDLTGQRVNRLTVVGMHVDPGGKNAARWVVKCLCGWYETRTAKALRDPIYFKRAMCSDCDFKQGIKEGHKTAPEVQVVFKRGEMGKQSILASIESDAARAGFFKKRDTSHDQHRTAWAIKCAKCPKGFSTFWSPQTSPELMIKNMRVRRWDVGKGLQPLCPDCAHPSKSPVNKSLPVVFEDTPFIKPLPETKLAQALVDAGIALAAKPQPAPMTFEEVLDRVAIEPPPSVQVAERAQKKIWLNIVTEEVTAGKVVLAEAIEKMQTAKEELLAAQQARAAVARAVRSQRCEERRQRKIAEAAAHLAEIARKNAEPQPPIKLSVPFVEIKMSNKPSPTPKITHAVFQQLDAVFDGAKRLYKHGWTDAKVAKECGTSEDVVTYLRFETFGELAEDPRLQSIKDDIQLLEMQIADVKKNSDKAIRDLLSRVDQLQGSMPR